MHDFMAERPDELDAKAGDMISVVAQSNREWFVAKPIGRLGGPGLIPVSFVEVREPSTGTSIADVDGMIDRGEIPRVEEWKKATMDYKARSIPLGRIEDDVQVVNSQFQNMSMTSPVRENPPRGFSPGPQPESTLPSAQQFPLNGYQPAPPNGPGPFDGNIVNFDRLEHVRPLPTGVLIRAEVSSFHKEDGDYHYRINATFRPDPPSSPTSPFDPAPLMTRELTLFRVYEDFYVFQIQLLEAFPLEAGRDPDHPNEPPEEDDEEAARRRILPYMPGPQDDVDDVIADSRRGDLDVYLQEMVALRNIGAEYVLRCDLVRKFFAARDRDIENEVEMELEDDYGIPNPADYGAASGYYEGEPQRDRRPLDEYETPFDDQPRTNGTNGTYMGGVTQFSSQNRPVHPYAQHGRGPSEMSADVVDRSSATSSEWNTGGTGMTYGGHPYVRDQHMSRTSSFGTGSPGGLLRSPQVYQGGGGYNDYPPSKPNNPGSIPPIPRDNGRDSSANTASPLFYSNPGQSPSNTTNPPISASNHNTAFVKIKIFHSSTDELIAIRVSPRVVLGQLMEKVRERLGSDVEGLKYRDGQAGGGGGPGGWVDIRNDVDLKSWMASGDKLVLYAE